MKVFFLMLKRLLIVLTVLLMELSSIQAQLEAQDISLSGEAPLSYEWERLYYGRVNNERKLLYTKSFARGQVSFADIDGDGDEDMVIGKADGQLAFFENAVVRGKNNFELRTEALTALHLESDSDGNLVSKRKVINVRANASPTFTDIDADGDLDLFIGSKDGTIFYYHNSGNSLLPVFELEDPAYMKLRPGTNSVPRFKDINNDRSPDLLVGGHSGKVYLYRNAGVPTQAKFCSEIEVASKVEGEQGCRYPREMIADIFPEVDASPAWGDWNYDGLWDVAVGKASGRIAFFYNRGNPFQPKWKLATDRFLFIDVGGYASPLFYDFNGDGFTELLVGTSTSKIVYYENREVLQTGLRKVEGLDLSEIDWKSEHGAILQKVCDQLEGAPLCLPPLSRAFNIPDNVEVSLEKYGDFIVRKKAFSTSDVSEEAETKETAPAPVPPGQEQAAITPNQNRLVRAQVNAGDPNPVPGNEPPPTDEAVSKASDNFDTTMANRNHLWLSTRNFLNFGHLLNNDRRAAVTSTDWDADGDIDLLIGGASGRLYAYENVGTTRNPNWRRKHDTIFEVNQRKESAPTFTDIDGDGDQDILVGNRLGRLELLLNIGTPQRPKWKIDNLLFADVDVGSNSIPALMDLDSDDDLDLFVGNSKGRVIYYTNRGSKSDARFSLKSTQFANLVEIRNLAPAFFPWNEDNALDLVVGGREGGMHVITNNHVEGTPFTQGWLFEEGLLDELNTISYGVPHTTDFDQDQKPDLILGDGDGNVLIWLNRGLKKVEPILEEEPVLENNSIEQVVDEDLLNAEEIPTVEFNPDEPPVDEELAQEALDLPFDPVYTFVTPQFISLEGYRRVVPAFFDLDVDGDLDVIIGTKSGKLLQYSNEGTVNQPAWTQVNDRFLDYKGGKNATPMFGDFDGDGDQDLLVGSARGKIHYWENQGTPEFPEFVPNLALFQRVSGGINARPTLVDVDQDGLNDLIIGNFRGQLVHYLQKTSGGGRSFRLVQRRYLGLDLGVGSTPTVADLNNDGLAELIIGSDHGDLLAFTSIPKEEDPLKWGWKEEVRYFSELEQGAPLGSFPVFTDIDQDNDIDLFIGGDNGSLYFYRNDGSAETPLQ